MSLLDTLHIQDSRVPKYRQIINGVIEQIAGGQLQIDDRIPSINRLSEEFGLSRDTVEKAYNVLKERRIITSVKGKGFYINRTQLDGKVNVLFMVNKLSTYKMLMYNTFRETIATSARIDLRVYHCEESLFLDMLKKSAGAYDYYLIMPHFRGRHDQHVSHTEAVSDALRSLPAHKLIILDNDKVEVGTDHSTVYQDFRADLYRALADGLTQIRRYRHLVLCFPYRVIYPYPKRIMHGFRHFCVEHKFDFEVIDGFPEDTILHEGDLFITIAETDLVNLVRQTRDQGLRLGQDIGIISYNETPLKDLLGITTVSTDFRAMGRTAAELVTHRRTERIKVPFSLTLRESL